MTYRLRYIPGTRLGKKLGRIRMGRFADLVTAEQCRQDCHNTDQLEVVEEGQ